MDFFSHNESDTNFEKKPLKRHLTNAALIAKNNLLQNLNFSIPGNTVASFLNDIVLFHDFGKYTTFFQNHLLGSTKKSDLSNHSHIGAYYIYNKYIKENPKLALIGYYLIKNHHSNFDDFEKEEIFLSDYLPILKEKLIPQFNDICKNFSFIESDMEISLNKDFIKVPEKALFNKIRQFDKNPTIENYFLINYLFSLLIEADKLDASNTPRYTRIDIDTNNVRNYLANKELETSLINNIRNNIKNDFYNALNKENLLSSNIFTLTAPTGSGKTLLNLEFALQLRNVLKEQNGNYPQIIYSLPFISIIEQTVQEVKKIFGENAKTLAHYQYSDLFDPDYADKENLSYDIKLQLLETWQSDIIVTSFVQLLQTLIGNRNKFLKKFHHLANSIIILDEVQAIGYEKLPVVGAALYFLTKFLNSKVILSTATRPFIFELANNLLMEKEQITFTELLPNHEFYFNQLNRTKLIPLLDKTFDVEEFVELFKSKYDNSKSALIVCNTINNSLKIFDLIEKYYGEDKVFYLSTNIIPLQKEKVLKNLKDLLDPKNNSDIKPILVSTQVIEAGVDLDFDMAFREISPIDSIIQSAGRVNRNNRITEPASVYIFDMGTCAKIYGKIAYTTTIKILTNHSEILEKEYLNIINTYFEELNNKKAFDYSKQIFAAMINLNYQGDDNNLGVAKFRLIEDDNFENSVFVEFDDQAKEVYQKYCEFINRKIDKKTFAQYVKLFNQYVISIPQNQINKKDLRGKGNNFYYINHDILSFYYKEKTGFIREEIANTCM